MQHISQTVLELSGDGGKFYPLRFLVPAPVSIPGIPERTVFVPDTAGAHVCLTSSESRDTLDADCWSYSAIFIKQSVLCDSVVTISRKIAHRPTGNII